MLLSATSRVRRSCLHPVTAKEPGKKICFKCKTEYDATLQFFHVSKKHKDGLVSWCKKCWSDYKFARSGSGEKRVSNLIPNVRRCRKCKVVKSIEQFELSSIKFNGRGSYCQTCADLLVLINAAPVGQRYCEICKQYRSSTLFGKTHRCRSCREVLRRRALCNANRRFYERNKDRVAARVKKARNMDGLYKNLEFNRDNTAVTGYSVAIGESMKHETFKKHIEQLQSNLLLVVNDVPIPETAVRIAIERIKGSSSHKIAKDLSVSRTAVMVILRLFGESKPKPRDYQFYAWAKPLIKTGVKLLDGIRYAKPKPSYTIWSKSDLQAVEDMLRDGLSPAIIGTHFKRDTSCGVIRRKLTQLYLKFGRMMRTRQIQTDWSCGGKFPIYTKQYKVNRAEAMTKIQRCLGLHHTTVKQVILTMRKYNEPEYQEPARSSYSEQKVS